MTSRAAREEAEVTGGVDTHKDSHTAAAVDGAGRRLGIETFPATTTGYRALLNWLRSFGRLVRVGVEGTGSCGAGLGRFLRKAEVVVLEVSCPSRKLRRQQGKSDPVDAEAAARAALAGEALGVPKTQDGPVEVIRMLRLQRRSAIKARTQAVNQLHAVVSTAPEEMRTGLRDLPLQALVAHASRFTALAPTSVQTAAEYVLRGLAERWKHLDSEVAGLDKQLATLVREVAPALIALRGVGTDVAGTLLVAAGDNPERLHREASFAALCGVSPLDASSGRQNRHRLNRGGNRDANRALWVIALVRMRCDPRTRAYVARRTQEGLGKPEILRCLKRYIVREVFKILTRGVTELAP